MANNLAPEVPNDTIFEVNSTSDGALPSGSAYTIPATPDPTPPANVIDSGWIPYTPNMPFASNYLKADQSLQLFVLNSHTNTGALPSGSVFPTLQNSAGSSRYGAAEFFEGFVRYVLVNTSGSTSNEWSVVARQLGAPHTGVVFTLDSPLFNNIPAPIVKTVPSSPLDFFENVGLPIQIEGVTNQDVLLDLTTIDPTDYGFAPGTVLKYVALGFDLSAVNTGYFEGAYSVSDAGTAKVRMAVERRSAGGGVGYAASVYEPEVRPEFATTVQVDFASGAGKVNVTGRIDGYLTEAV